MASGILTTRETHTTSVMTMAILEVHKEDMVVRTITLEATVSPPSSPASPCSLDLSDVGQQKATT